MAPGDLINFDVIESQKENIQSIPSGRSAKKLAQLFSPSPALQPKQTATTGAPSPQDTKTIHEHIRAEFEVEITNLSESDDPLDVYERYVQWTLDAYPSAQATPQSQLHTVLERATKTFVSHPQYKNDPRYLKLWVLYIQFFSDAPRETFVFLSRHGIGENLALFYEEYAAWLEGAGRWAQAEEVYKLGIEREARPPQRLVRKFGEFEQRRAAQEPEGDDAPSSPALPTVRPALAAKIDPFAAAAAARDPQAPRATSGVGGAPSKPARSKLTIFSDADAAQPAMSSGTESKGWESIGSLADRKKENVMEPKPWVGETLKAGGKKTGASKMAVFRDPSLAKQLSKSHIPIHHSQSQVTINQNGKKERVFVDLRAVYPSPDEPGTELSFEEVWAANRGWLDQTWEDEAAPALPMDENRRHDVDMLAENVSQKLVVHHDVVDVVRLDENGAPILPKTTKPKKKKVIEVNETQIIKAKLDSPSRPKLLKKKHTSEPTMTMHTKAATDDIYDIFNAPIKPPQEEEGLLGDDDYETDDYTSGGESTMTTRNISVSEAGDDEEEEDIDAHVEDETSDVKSVSEWSDFSTRKHIPQIGDGQEQDDTQVSDLIDVHDSEPSSALPEGEEEEEEIETPVHENMQPKTRTVFVPIPPEDYEPPTRPYRDPFEVANNRLPFMTPITERTETSLDVTPDYEQDIHARTPSKRDDGLPPIRDDEDEDEEADDNLDLEPLSSPLREVVSERSPKGKIAQPLLQKSKPLAPKALTAKVVPPKGPIIKESQCNPIDDSVRDAILASMQPPLSSYEGFYDHRDEKCEKGTEIRKHAKALSKAGRNSTDKTGTLATQVTVQFPDTEREYSIRKELGAGAFAPVYLVENSHPDDGEAATSENDENSPVAMMGKGAFASAHHRRGALEALKMEMPPTPWEFHMMRLSHARLGSHHRATASLSAALEMHLYQDDGFLLLPYHPHGTLLDVVNLFRAEPSGVMEETLAMFFTVELFRTVEALHAKQILHGDLKADNCLLRLDGITGGAGGDQQSPLSGAWRADGAGGWAARGVTLIDFGRAIDMRAFTPDVQFVADWKTTAQDCAEMREGRPWTWQIDYHGLAGIVHCLLFGRYIETVRSDAGALGTSRRYKIRESLKRYWQADIWGDCFDVLLNPGQFVGDEDGARMPVLRTMRGVRERMEAWLEANCERGVGLRSLMAKVEAWAKGRR
ncbi:hypothetical protein GQ53DRAFT_794575 [Thozetella sp. PMI_491]|nr:hypothetical protein GQ53DRAFT_794575 [Thozetella sp. PMI_491]